MQLVRARRLHQERVEGDRQVVEVQQAQRRARGTAHTAWRFPAAVTFSTRADRGADELHRVGEIGQDERADRGAGVGVVACCTALAIAFGATCRTFFEVLAVVDEVLGDVGQSLDLFGGLVPAARDESLSSRRRPSDRLVSARVQIGSAVVQDAGQRGEPVLELHDLVVAVAQRVTKICRFLMMSTMLPLPSARMRPDTGQLGQRLAQLVPVAVHGVGRAVDEPADRRGRHVAWRTQFGCQPRQLVLDLVPFDGHRGAVDAESPRRRPWSAPDARIAQA